MINPQATTPTPTPTLSVGSLGLLDTFLHSVQLPVGHVDFEAAALRWVELKRELAAIAAYHAASSELGSPDDSLESV